jgi:phosphoribosylglycinamide formyltransferase 1
LNKQSTQQSVVVLISGRGSNMQALVECSRRDGSAYKVSKVLSDKPDAAGLEIARSFGVSTEVVASAKGQDRETYGRTLAAAIDHASPSLVVLAGFMRILSAEFVGSLAGRILNIHPSLLPKFPGLHTHRRALDAQETEHGATVHFVTAQLDGGPPVIQARVSVKPDDDEAKLAARVQSEEHLIYPLAVQWFCQGRLRLTNGFASLDGVPLREPVQYGNFGTTVESAL